MIFRIILTLFILSVPGSVVPAENHDTAWVAASELQVAAWQSELDEWQKKPPSLSELEARQNEVFFLRQRAEACVKSFSEQKASVDEKLAALGDEEDDEPQEIRKRRQDLSQQQDTVDSELAVCRLISLGVKELQEAHKNIRKELLSQALSHREEPVWTTLIKLLKNPVFITKEFHLSFSIWPATLAGVLSFLILLPLARYVVQTLKRKYLDKPERFSTETLHVVGMFSRRLPWLAALASLALFGYVGGAVSAAAVLFVLAISLLLAPFLELLLCYEVDDCKAGLPARILFDLVLIGSVVYFSDIGNNLTTEAYRILLAGYFLLVMLFSLWLLFSLSKRENFHYLGTFRTPVALAMLSGPISMLIGYQSLSGVLIPGVYGTLAGLLIAWVLFTAGNLFFGLFEPGDGEAPGEVRKFLGYRNDERVPGLWIGRLLMVVAVVSGLFYWFLVVWQIPSSQINTISSYFTDGFPVGAITVVPGKILSAILAFFILLTLARWLKNQLSERWLNKTRLDSGARESVVSLTTYTIVGLALVLALGMAGVDFQNVAIVAGALSVGIGFGLQNIVNNFVSGLILLFERPVKPGDWVIVGSTEGYVKKISIRYTLIQTFDRADVLVPNSELISSQVTNWMHKDTMGRVSVPVGVAYGSDVNKVREILHQVAADHPFVLINDWRVPGPKVLFMGFGESSLDFELRCFIKDVDYRLSVRSDLLFAIDAKFREENIEIPFPQRVIHTAEADRKDQPDNAG